MDHQQAWQTVLGQLQMEMPRASFDTWVRDTKALSYEEGCLIIGVRNAYTRDWLESRLKSTVSRLLVGIMNRTVTVDFVVNQPNLEDGDSDDESDVQEGERGLHQIDVTASTRYEEEVKPHRIVMFPGYALRLLEQGDLSAREMSLWVAFRQAVYATQKEVGDKRDSVTRNIPYQEIIRFANMSEPTYRRAISGDENSFAGGLLRRLPDQGSDTGNPHFDNATRWQVFSSPRLTLRDSAVIANLLEAEVSLAKNREEKITFALDALRRMAGVHPADWLESVNVDVPKTAPPKVITILRSVLGVAEDIPANLFEATEALENRLMSAFGKVVITHHFLQVVAPALNLTQPQMWAIISLRDHRYYDHKKRAQYDYIFAKKGVKTLSEWSGVSLKSFGRWMDSPVFGSLVQKVDIEAGQDEYLDSLIASGGEVYRLRGDEPPLWFEENGDTIIAHWTERPVGLDKVIGGSGQSDRRDWTKRYAEWDKVIGGIGQSDRCLNNLIKPHLNPSNPHKALPTTPESEFSGKTSPSAQGGGGWDMPSLLKLNPVSNKKIKDQILKKGDPVAFVSWILYGYSPEGKGIDSPSNLAISNIASEPRQGAKAIYMQIAKLDLDVLRGQIYKLLRPHEKYNVDAWMRSREDKTVFAIAFRKVSSARLLEMASCLFEDALEI
ncbi:MAG: hypothetical protein HN741_11185 [Anaerolineae bacterium]|nr:hypothetical protein [Anaerolineae bacterium]